MKVYRIEDDRGNGPYNWREWRTHDHNAIEGNPPPSEDDLIDTSDDKPFDSLHDKCKVYVYLNQWEHHFGCESMKSLCKWFNEEELFNLWGMGMKISIYEATSWLRFEKQVAFVIDSANLIEEISLEKIVDNLTKSA